MTLIKVLNICFDSFCGGLFYITFSKSTLSWQKYTYYVLFILFWLMTYTIILAFQFFECISLLFKLYWNIKAKRKVSELFSIIILQLQWTYCISIWYLMFVGYYISIFDQYVFSPELIFILFSHFFDEFDLSSSYYDF